MRAGDEASNAAELAEAQTLAHAANVAFGLNSDCSTCRGIRKDEPGPVVLASGAPAMLAS